MGRKDALVCLLLGALCSSSVVASELADWLRVDAFGTVGMYRADDPVAGFRAEPKQAAFSRQTLRFDGDTQFSLQGTLNPDGKVKGVLQLLSKKMVEGSYKPSVEWAYLSWDATRELNLKLGRTVAPVFMMSDYLNLNYANTMVRMQAAYSVNPITYQDGAAGLWQRKFGPGELQVEGFYGSSRVEYSIGTIDFKKTMGLSAKWTQGPWAIRLGQSSATLRLNAPVISAAVASLTALPSAYCSNCSTVVPDRVRQEHSVVKIVTVGSSYDDGELIGQAEWMHHDGTSITVGDHDGVWLMGGYRIATLTPYVSYSQYKTNTAQLGLLAGPSAPPAVAAQLSYLNKSYLGGGVNDRSIIAFGVRWDFMKHMALKAQVDLISVPDRLAGANATLVVPTSLLGKPSGFDGKINVLTLNLDFAF